MFRQTIIFLILATTFCFGQNKQTTFLYSDTVLTIGQTHVSNYARPMSAVIPDFVYQNRELVDSILYFLKKNPKTTVTIETHTWTFSKPEIHYHEAELISKGLVDELKWKGIPDSQYKIIIIGDKQPIYNKAYLSKIKDEKNARHLNTLNLRFKLTVTQT